MKLRAIVVETDGQARMLVVERGQMLTPLQEAVGGYIERVAVQDNRVDFWVNEEGKLHGLPVNQTATELLYRLDPRWFNWDVLVGPVVLTGGSDGQGGSLTVPDFLLDWFIELVKQ